MSNTGFVSWLQCRSATRFMFSKAIYTLNPKPDPDPHIRFSSWLQVTKVIHTHVTHLAAHFHSGWVGLSSLWVQSVHYVNRNFILWLTNLPFKDLTWTWSTLTLLDIDVLYVQCICICNACSSPSHLIGPLHDYVTMRVCMRERKKYVIKTRMKIFR